MTTAKKITLATLKSFIRKAGENLHVMTKTQFDGMEDCVVSTGDREFTKARYTNEFLEHTLGVRGVWLVGGSRNSFSAFERGGFRGIHVYNCCGSFDVAVPIS